MYDGKPRSTDPLQDGSLCTKHERIESPEMAVLIARNKLRHPERHNFKTLLRARRVVEQHERRCSPA